jgi:hypothetical protein
MTDPAKNRRLTLTRKKDEPAQEEPLEATYEIPRASKAEIRHLIETEGLGSPTEIAERLNKDGFPCAQAETWSAKLVDSALRRKDMLDLRERLRENRGPEEPAPVTPDDIRKAAFDGAKEAFDALDLREMLKPPEIKLPEIPPLKVDTFTIKETVTAAVDGVLKEHLRHFEAADRASAAEIVSGVKESLKTVLTAAFANQDMVAVRRTTDATSRNVGDILKRIDVVCEDLHDTVTKSFAEHRTEIANNCESMALQLCDQVDKRISTLESTLVAKFSSHGAIDALLARVVDARLKAHMDGVVNQFAVMLESLKRDMRGESRR